MAQTRFNLFCPKEEHQLLRTMVRKFAAEVLQAGALERDTREFFDQNLFRKLGDLGLLGITVPAKYGGSEMDATAAVIAHEELASVDPGFTLAYLAHSMLCVNNLAVNSSEEQKENYLPKLCSGQWIGAMAMSEPDIGTDVLAMRTTAQKNSHGYLINGRKMWITNGVIDNKNSPCDFLFLYAKTGELSNKPVISSFIIKNNQSGYAVGQKLTNKLGMRASATAELVFENCQISESQRVGSEGDALKHMMKNLEIERLALAAISLGIARKSLEIMNSYAQERFSFGRSINNFGQIQKYIAESYAKYKACKSYVYNTAYNYNFSHTNSRVDSDGVKLISATMAKEVSDAAIQVLGGNGYMGEYIVERLWRDAKLIEIGGGTIEAHQKNITRDLSKNNNLFFE